MNDKPQLIIESVGHVHQSKNEVEENRRKNDGYIVLTTLNQRADVKNQMGRIYPKELLQREFRNYQKYVDNASALGECDHPDTAVVALDRASHLITRQWEHIDEHGSWCWYVDMKLLNTEAGIKCQRLIEDGVRISVSVRGAGTVQKSHTEDADVVSSNYVYICTDIVSQPSVVGAHANLKEAFDLSQNKEAYERYLENRIQIFVDIDLKSRIIGNK